MQFWNAVVSSVPHSTHAPETVVVGVTSQVTVTTLELVNALITPPPAEPVPSVPLTITALPTPASLNGADVAQVRVVGVPVDPAPSVTICPSPTAPKAVTENSHG